jgi:hypothetical protein
MSDNDFHILRFSQGNRNRGKVENKEIIWRKFCRKFVEPSVDQSITYAQYLKLGVDDQGAKKSAAGYIVGAPFADGKRRLANMQKRNLISLDLDEVTADQMDDIELGISALCEYEFLRHTSRKHCQEKPRWRIHLPISRACDHDEANAITRILSARTRALLLQEESQAVSPAEIIADTLGPWLNEPVTQDVAEGRDNGQFDDEDDRIALGHRTRVTLSDAWHKGLGRVNDPAPYDLQNLSTAIKMIPGWSSNRLSLNGSKVRLSVRDGSDWKKTAWEPV